MGKKTKTFEFPDDLRAAQRALDAARAERSAFLASVPKWAEPIEKHTLRDGTVIEAAEGWSEEQHAEAARLLAGEREAALVMWGHAFWAGVPVEDQVDARQQLKHIDGQAAAA